MDLHKTIAKIRLWTWINNYNTKLCEKNRGVNSFSPPVLAFYLNISQYFHKAILSDYLLFEAFNTFLILCLTIDCIASLAGDKYFLGSKSAG